MRYAPQSIGCQPVHHSEPKPSLLLLRIFIFNLTEEKVHLFLGKARQTKACRDKFSGPQHIACAQMGSHLKAGVHLQWGNTKPSPYKAASAQLVWTVYVHHTPSTNRINHRLSHFDVPSAHRSVSSTHEAMASGGCMVHTTRVEAALHSLGVASLQVCAHLYSEQTTNKR